MPRKRIGSFEIHVRVRGARYGVLVAPGVLGRLRRELGRLERTRICVITNDRVWGYWGATLEQGLHGLRRVIIRIPDGEEHKSLATIEFLASELLRVGADRGALLVGFGGGVVGDITGFLASIYLRGVDYVHVPTTLLAQIDSSLGGKTGVNLRAGKNLLGTFYHPRRVIVDPEVLRTLPGRELQAGIYEAIKCGVIRSRPLFEFLERNREPILGKNLEALTRVIHDCLSIKARVVSEDEKERDLRRILNFGHTLGHALESETGYRYFLHGEAVAWGMRAATLIAEERRMIRLVEAARIHALLMGYGRLPALVRLEPSHLVARLTADKKTRNGVLHFVLPERIGKVRIVSGVDDQAVVRALDTLMRE